MNGDNEYEHLGAGTIKNLMDSQQLVNVVRI